MDSDRSGSQPYNASLFPEDEIRASGVQPATPDRVVQTLAGRRPAGLWLGTSSWHFPGWAGLVWDRLYDRKRLSREGLAAYAQHPLFNAVGLDRGFYRALSVDEYTAYARAVPAAFRFVVKAPSLVTDAMVRDADGKGRRVNPYFLDGAAARQAFVEPAVRGLGEKIGALVFQLSPLPRREPAHMDTLVERLHAMLQTVTHASTHLPAAVIAVEVRNREWLTPALVAALKDTGATYCLGLHPKMPPIDAQLPTLRALWPGPLVCRWNLNAKHGAFGYEKARDDYAPFDRLVDPDPDTRAALARVIAGTVAAGQPAYVTVNNKAEGSSPLSIGALAEAVLEAMR